MRPISQRLYIAFSGVLLLSGVSFFLSACANTEIIESPKTTFFVPSGESPKPQIIWTSRTLSQDFDYLAVVKSRSWTYNGAIERLVRAAQSLHADALIDVHYESVGFLNSMQAFAIKYK